MCVHVYMCLFEHPPAGLYRYKPLYEVSNAEEIVELIERSQAGVDATELSEVSFCLFFSPVRNFFCCSSSD